MGKSAFNLHKREKESHQLGFLFTRPYTIWEKAFLSLELICGFLDKSAGIQPLGAVLKPVKLHVASHSCLVR